MCVGDENKNPLHVPKTTSTHHLESETSLDQNRSRSQYFKHPYLVIHIIMGEKVKIPTKFSFFFVSSRQWNVWKDSWWVFFALIGKKDQTGGSYLPRCVVRRGRKRRSKASSSSSRWNVFEVANFGRERPYRCCACRKLAEPIRVCSEREESSAPRVRHGFLQPSPLTLTSFMETFAVAATRARLRNGPARIEEIPQDCTRDASEFNGTR